MKRNLTLFGLLALASCAPADPPPAPAAPRQTVTAPAPAPAKPPPRPRPTPAPAGSALAQYYLPAFTFRAVDGAGSATVEINGVSLVGPRCTWAVNEALEFDPKVRVETWPPEDTLFVGSSRHPDIGHADLYLDQKADLAARYPHLRAGESLLYVDGTLGGRRIRGAVRLFVERCKVVVYTPLVDPEGEEASRFLRTIWFDRKRNE